MGYPVLELRAYNKHIWVPGVPSHEERREIQGEEHEVVRDAVSILPQEDPQGAQAGLEVDAHRLRGGGGAPEQHAAAHCARRGLRGLEPRGGVPESHVGLGAGFAHARFGLRGGLRGGLREWHLDVPGAGSAHARGGVADCHAGLGAGFAHARGACASGTGLGAGFAWICAARRR